MALPTSITQREYDKFDDNNSVKVNVVTGGNATVNIAGGNIGGVQAVYMPSPPAIASGASTSLYTDANGNLQVREQFAPGYEDNTANKAVVEQRYTYASFISVSTIAVKASAGFLHRFMVCMPSCPTTVFYDSAVSTGTEILRLHAGFPVGSYEINVSFSNGLSIDTVRSGGGVLPYIVTASR